MKSDLNRFTQLKNSTNSYTEEIINSASIRARENLRDTEQQTSDFTLWEKQIAPPTASKSLSMSTIGRRSTGKNLRGFESKIILLKTAAKEIKKAELTKLSFSKYLKAESDGLTTCKTPLQLNFRKIQQIRKEHDVI